MPTGALTIMTQQIPGLKPGDQFEIALEANATTGFRWDVDIGPTATGRVELVEETYDLDSSKVGAGGVQRFRFRAVRAGDATLTFRYRRSWEKDKARQQRDYRVHIEDGGSMT